MKKLITIIFILLFSQVNGQSIESNKLKNALIELTKDGNINKLKMIRNLGAHIKPIERKIANDFFTTFKSTFNEIINNYKFSKN